MLGKTDCGADRVRQSSPFDACGRRKVRPGIGAPAARGMAVARLLLQSIAPQDVIHTWAPGPGPRITRTQSAVKPPRQEFGRSRQQGARLSPTSAGLGEAVVAVAGTSGAERMRITWMDSSGRRRGRARLLVWPQVSGSSPRPPSLPTAAVRRVGDPAFGEAPRRGAAGPRVREPRRSRKAPCTPRAPGSESALSREPECGARDPRPCPGRSLAPG